jgi:hypothetical protein
VNGATARWRHALLLGLALLALGFLFAQAEIQIEGGKGWAAGLPTWRIENHPWVSIFWGGKPITGYHVWIFAFMATMFHLPFVMFWTFSLRLECRVIGSVMVFWIIEDFLWFALNPAFGPARFKPDFIPWHKVWVLGIPADYWVFAAAGGLLIGWSFRPSRPAEGVARTRETSHGS